ncbi:MAG TPA: hypothetical protein VL588_00875 [Bdellovibrionota bacterium]|nr:hypothetical protein [Bdellovibrionota bacterium]
MAQVRTFFIDEEELLLDRNGIWRSNGVEVAHDSTTDAFHRFLEPDGSGGWRIKIGPETKSVKIEDTPRFVTTLEGGAEKGFTLVLAGGKREALDPATLAYQAPDRLTCKLRDGTTARFLRRAYYEITKSLEKDGGKHVVVIAGKRYPLD